MNEIQQRALDAIVPSQKIQYIYQNCLERASMCGGTFEWDGCDIGETALNCAEKQWLRSKGVRVKKQRRRYDARGNPIFYCDFSWSLLGDDDDDE